MKRCPHCGSTYTDHSLIYCLQDGEQLVSVDFSRAETLINPEIQSTEELNTRIRDLEKENAALEKAREYASNLYEEARKEIEKLQNEKTSLIDELKQLAWLGEIAERDKNDISRYVYIIFKGVNYEGLNNIEPYIEIVFDIINASVYKITIDKNIEDGAVYFNTTRLHPKLAELDGYLQSVSRDEKRERVLVIRQGLGRELAERIKTPQPDDKLIFSRLWINVKGADDKAEVRPQRLGLPSEITLED